MFLFESKIVFYASIVSQISEGFNPEVLKNSNCFNECFCCTQTPSWGVLSPSIKMYDNFY